MLRFPGKEKCVMTEEEDQDDLLLQFIVPKDKPPPTTKNSMTAVGTGDAVLHECPVFAEMHQDEAINTCFSSLDAVAEFVADYRLVIHKSIVDIGYRQYKCRSHVGCPFSLSFGRSRAPPKVIKLKRFCSKHGGTKEQAMEQGGADITTSTTSRRAEKCRIKGFHEEVVDEIRDHKDGKPVAKDIMRAVAKVHNSKLKYQQAYRLLSDNKQSWSLDAFKSYELIVPYLLAL